MALSRRSQSSAVHRSPPITQSSFPHRASASPGLRSDSKKTVIRAGFGIYYALLDNLSYRLDQNPPFNTVLAVKGVTGHNFVFVQHQPHGQLHGARI